MPGFNNEKYIGVPLSWNDIKNYFPNTWIGLDVLEYDDPNETSIKIARVLYTGTSEEIAMKQIQGLTNDTRCTIPVGLQVGVLPI